LTINANILILKVILFEKKIRKYCLSL